MRERQCDHGDAEVWWGYLSDDYDMEKSECPLCFAIGKLEKLEGVLNDIEMCGYPDNPYDMARKALKEHFDDDWRSLKKKDDDEGL